MINEKLQQMSERVDQLVEIEKLKKDKPNEKPDYDQMFKYADGYYQYGKHAIWNEKEVEWGLKEIDKAKQLIEWLIAEQTHGTVWMLEKYMMDRQICYPLVSKYYDCLKEEAFYKLESFIYFMERNRPQEKRFYLPRRKTLGTVLGDLEDLANRKIKFLGISLPSRTGKSTLCIFFLAWICLKRPNSHSAMGGHSGELVKGFYGELLNLFTTEEYAFKELYEYFQPEKQMIQNKSAESYTITLDQPDRFATITCRGADATWTGAIDVSWDGILYIDDLVRDRQHSLSPSRMEETFQAYLNKMVDRKSGFDPKDGSFAGACELMVGTLWNVLDPLERMRNKYEDNPLYRFRRIPALNDNDESNFDYEIGGFTTEYFKEMRERLDNAEWMAKYQQKPYVREGLLYSPDELRYFNGILPDGDARTVAVVDVAWGGGDFLSMPIGKEYDNGDVYIFDWVFDNGPKESTIPKVVARIMSNNIRQCQFEGNVGGQMYSVYVDDELRKQNYKCSCTEKKAPNNMAKMEKIIAYSGDVKRRFIFLTGKQMTEADIIEDAKNGVSHRYTRSKEYEKAMEQVCSFVTIGKNPFDDAVDSLTQLEMFLDGNGVSKVEAMTNPFRGTWREDY